MKFFVLKKPKSGSPEDAAGGIEIMQAKGTETGDFPTCPNCQYPLGVREWLPPYQVEVETWGQSFGDICRVGDGLVVSERFVNLCDAAGLKGLSSIEPVVILRIVNRKGKPQGSVPRYYKTVIAQSSTTVDQEASGYVWGDRAAKCAACLRGGDVKRYSKVVVDEKTWDGLDIFWPRGGPCILVTERFKSACLRYDILGVVFGLPELESYDLRPWEAAG